MSNRADPFNINLFLSGLNLLLIQVFYIILRPNYNIN